MSIEAIKKALEGVTPDRVERLWWFLHIMSKSSGSTNADDDKWNWINAFCTDYEDDTFNRAEKLGFIKVSHDSFMETSKAGMTPAGFSFINYFEKATSVTLISEIDRLQRENAALREDRYKLACAITGGEDAPGLLDSTPTSEIIEIAQHAHRMHQDDIDRTEAAEAEVKRLRDRYECWMPVTDAAPVGLHPDALLHFYCISDEVDGEESPEYWKTDTWEDKPADAVCWCAIVSPLGPHERTFIARTALASTGGDHHGN